MTLLEELAENGADIKDGLNRLMNNEAIYTRLLKKLPESINNENVNSFFEADDVESAIKATHTIKGITGNLSVTPLYKAYTEIVNLLRAKKVDEARKLYEETLPVQEKIIEIINRY